VVEWEQGFVELSEQKARHTKQFSLPDRGRELKGGGEEKKTVMRNV